MIIQLKKKIQIGFLKFPLTLLFLVVSFFIFSQTQERVNKNSLYQNILNHPEFIKILDNDTSLLCNGTLVYKSNSIDTGITLKFKDKQLIHLKDNKNKNCSQLSISKISPKKRFTLKTVIIDFKNQELNGKCLSSRSISFECKIKRKKSTYKIIKTETKYWTSNALLL